jgi:hypothetical protein
MNSPGVQGTTQDAQHLHINGLSPGLTAGGLNQFDHWYELRLKGNAPERRSYHSSFIYDNRLFIFGGLDIREGSMNSLWELNLRYLSDLELDENSREETCMWK